MIYESAAKPARFCVQIYMETTIIVCMCAHTHLNTQEYEISFGAQYSSNLLQFFHSEMVPRITEFVYKNCVPGQWYCTRCSYCLDVPTSLVSRNWNFSTWTNIFYIIGTGYFPKKILFFRM